MSHDDPSGRRICIFGDFGDINLGNDSTLKAMLCYVFRRFPGAAVTCVCTDPKAIKQLYKIDAVSMNGIVVKPAWLHSHRLARAVRKIIIGVPTELYRWLEAFRVLKGMDVFVVPGTGLLNDAYGLLNWGPYTMFKWALLAKLRGCTLLFVSVGAGPIYSFLGRWLVKSALALADFRSYRDQATKDFLSGVGFPTVNDAVYPDLAFSLPDGAKLRHKVGPNQRRVVGLGVMLDAGPYGGASSGNTTYRRYMDTLALLGEWLLAREYDIRLLIGGVCDQPVRQELKCRLKKSLTVHDADRIIEEPDVSVDEFLSGLAGTEFVVATRFHNVLLALLCNKPVIAISFHPKCSSLMHAMGLSEYCLDINHLDADKLIGKVRALEQNTGDLRPLIRSRVDQFRAALEEQFETMFNPL